MDYTDKVCPFCQTKFKDGDDIVICSICEMPHHKDCWIENAACTTFGCTGTISGINAEGAVPVPQPTAQLVTPGTQAVMPPGPQFPVPPGTQAPVPPGSQYTYTMSLYGGNPPGNIQSSTPQSKTCPHCGTPCPTSYRFCTNCGSSLFAISSPPQSSVQGQPGYTPPASTYTYGQPQSGSPGQPEQGKYTPPSASGQQSTYIPPSASGQQSTYTPPSAYGQQSMYTPPSAYSQQSMYAPSSAYGQQNAYSQSGAYGQPLPGVHSQGIPFEQDLAYFIGDNNHYYLTKKADMSRNNSTVSWNWCSFLFSTCWIIYRKMYGPAIGLWIGMWLVLLLIPELALIITIGVAVVMGMIGNNMYLKHAEGKVTESRMMHPSQKPIFMAKYGGASIGAVFGLIGANTLITLFFVALYA